MRDGVVCTSYHGAIASSIGRLASDVGEGGRCVYSESKGKERCGIYPRGSRTCAALDVRLLQEKELALPSPLLLLLQVSHCVRSGCGSETTSSENGLQIELSGECGVGSAQGSAAEELLDMVKVAIWGWGGRLPNNGIRLNHQRW